MPFLIVVYDIDTDYVQKVHDTLRKYLFWVQNSVFEGELSEARLKQMKAELEEIAKGPRDMILIYRMENKKYLDRQIIGVEKLPFDAVF